MSSQDIAATWPSWLEQSQLLHLAEASSYTFVSGASLGQVHAAFGVEDDTILTSNDLAGGIFAVAVIPCGDGWLVLEDNGFQGARPEVLRLASSGGVAASMYWNVNMTNRLSLASDGAVSAFVDVLDPEDVHGDASELMRTWLRRLAADSSRTRPLGVMAAASLAGLPLIDLPDRDDLEFHPIIAQLEDLHLEHASSASLRYGAADLVDRVGSLAPGVQRALARQVAELLLASGGQSEGPPVRAVVEQLTAPGQASFDAAMPLLLEAHRDTEVLARGWYSWTGQPRPPALTEAWNRKSALTALRYACEPDAEAAALGALTGLRLLEPDAWVGRASSLLDDIEAAQG